MTDTKHTPGQWRIIEHHKGKYEIRAINTEVACLDDVLSKSNRENEANARLIACAPELLDALESTLNLIAMLDFGDTPTIKKYKQLIAKAKGETMSNTKEQELKPCRCGKSDVEVYAIHTSDDKNMWSVCCNHCNSHMKYFRTKAEAIAAWNQYVAPVPAPQWTKEPPSKEGWYWVSYYYDGERRIQIVEIYNDRHQRKCVRWSGHIAYYTDYFINRFQDVHWQPIPEPPLPAESEETP
jgi:hypothetical protein